MTIDEAIKILDLHVRGRDCYSKLVQIEATKLGIEALKLTQKLRDRHILDVMNLLPGETEE